LTFLINRTVNSSSSLIIIELFYDRSPDVYKKMHKTVSDGEKNFPRSLKFEIDDSTLFKPEPPRFKQKKSCGRIVRRLKSITAFIVLDDVCTSELI